MRFQRIRPLITVLALIVISAPVVLLLSGADLQATDDGEQFLLRSLTLKHALLAHPIYPRWLPDLFLGYGYPVFTFYSPLAYCLVVAVDLLGAGSPDVATKFVGGVSVFLGASGAFVLGRGLTFGRGSHPWREIVVGIGTAVIYVGAPYPFVTNLLLRGDLPEALALAVLPWFWLRIRLIVHDRRDPGPSKSDHAVIAGVLGAVLILTHQLSALIVVATVGCVIIGHAPILHPRAWWDLFWGGTIAVGTTAFFWVPVIAESSAVRLGVAGHALTEIVGRLAPISTPIAMVWPYRFGWDPVLRLAPNGPLLPSVMQALITVLGFAVVALLCVRRRSFGHLSGDVATCALVILVFWTLNLRISEPVWDSITAIRYLQFPWRLLGPLALGVALVGAMLLDRVPTGMGAVVVVLATFGIWVETIVGLPDHGAWIASPPFGDDAMRWGDYAFDRWGSSTTTGDGEFTPRVVNITRPDGSQGGAIRLDRLAPPGAWIGGLLLFPEGQGRVRSLQGDALRFRAVIDVGEVSTPIVVHQIAFPGWQATIDGVTVPVRPMEAIAGSGVTPGFLRVDIPAGEHEFAIWFAPTPIRLAGDVLSVVTVLGLIVSVVKGRQYGRVGPVIVGAVTVLGAVVLWVALAEFLSSRSPVAREPDRERIVVDLVDAVQAGRVIAASPTGSALGPTAFLDAGWLSIVLPQNRPHQIGLTRQWLYMHPPSRVTVRVRVPGGAVFQAGLAIRPDGWETSEGDGVIFVVEVVPVVDGAGGEEVFRQRLNPRAWLDERRWVDVRVDLAPWAGHEIDLTLRTDPVANVAYDWAGWGNPTVVVPVGVLRYPNGPQPPASIGTPRTWMVDQ